MLFPALTSTTDESLMLLKYQIRKNALDNFNNFVETQNDWIRFIWNNESFSPQTIVSSLSSDAVNYFNLTTNFRMFLSATAIDNNVSVNLLKPLSAFTLSGGVVNIINAPYVGP